jgi:hypothetical protein
MIHAAGDDGEHGRLCISVGSVLDAKSDAVMVRLYSAAANFPKLDSCEFFRQRFAAVVPQL